MINNKEIFFQIIDIIRGTTVDGPGFRTAIYMAGCCHECPGCHNPQSHDPEGGELMLLKDIMDIVREEDFDVTLTGGDPLYNPQKVLVLAKAIKEAGYNIWLYTGYTIEEICQRDDLANVLPYVDTLVDGRFVEALRNPDLRFRGSSNQRIIHLH